MVKVLANGGSARLRAKQRRIDLGIIDARAVDFLLPQ
jgi:hypothetical protein